MLVANRPVGNYWVRFTGLMDCDQRFTKAHQVAVLHYEGAPEREPKEPVLQLNSLNVALNHTGSIRFPVLVANKKTDDPVHLHDPVMDSLGDSLDVELVNKLNREGRLARNLENPPFSGQVTS
ncbi:iron assimilation by reduction and transport [Homalodisca vitripennis]|nr:iron assimilation by reduction and transport [Homalodisca vitripennis]